MMVWKPAAEGYVATAPCGAEYRVRRAYPDQQSCPWDVERREGESWTRVDFRSSKTRAVEYAEQLHQEQH